MVSFLWRSTFNVQHTFSIHRLNFNQYYLCYACHPLTIDLFIFLCATQATSNCNLCSSDPSLNKDDSGLENNIAHFGLEHKFRDVTWYSAELKVVYRVDDRVLVYTYRNGVNDFILLHPTFSPLL